jgi:hypothetical protein
MSARIADVSRRYGSPFTLAFLPPRLQKSLYQLLALSTTAKRSNRVSWDRDYFDSLAIVQPDQTIPYLDTVFFAYLSRHHGLSAFRNQCL